MKSSQRRLWISWERQRRTIELSEYFNCELQLILHEGSGFVRYFKCMLSTVKAIRKSRPDILFVQNPSLILAVFVVLIKPFFSYTLIVDRHTNFKFDKRKLKHIKWKAFWFLSNFSLRHADYTIVTNHALKRIINFIGAKGLVLQDKLPQMSSSESYPIQANQSLKRALFVCTYAYDEPVDEVVKAFSDLGPDYEVYISGNWKKQWSQQERDALPANIVPTGFISEQQYKSLMAQVDAVIVFTTNDYTLTCGAYEALSLNKPALLSDKKALREYFGDTCFYCNESSVSDMSSAIKSIFAETSSQSEQRSANIKQLESEWEERAASLNRLFTKIV